MDDSRTPGTHDPHTSQDDDARALLAAYALGTADAAERAAVEALLPDDPAAAAELAACDRLVELMHYSAPPVVAPPALEAALRAALSGTSQVAATVATPPPMPAVASPAPASGRSWKWLWPALAASSAVMLLLFGLNLWQLSQIAALLTENAMLQAQLAEQAGQVAALNQEVATQASSLSAIQDHTDWLGETLANRTELLAATIARAGETYDMTPPAAGSPAYAQVGWFDAGGVGILQARDFPPLGPEMAYQLWLIKDGQRTSGGLFTVSDTGSGTLIFTPPATLDSFDSMGITPEPAGGSPGPTAPPVVTGSLHEG